MRRDLRAQVLFRIVQSILNERGIRCRELFAQLP